MTRRVGARQRAAERTGAAAAAPLRRAAARGAHSCSELAVQVRAAMLNGGGAEAACGRAPPRTRGVVRYSRATPLPSFLRCARQEQQQAGARARRRAAAAPRLAGGRGMAAMDVDAAAAPPLRTRQVTRDVACPTTYFRLGMCVRSASLHSAHCRLSHASACAGAGRVV